MTKLELPIELEEHREALEKSLKPYIKITEHEAETTPYQSKLGGYPYYPKDLAYPVGSKGQVMRLLVQLNFNEMPNLEGFPTEGILQIFIPVDDEVFGGGYWDEAEVHKVIYHKEITKDESLIMSEFPHEKEASDYFPIERELALSFEVKEETVPYDDVRSNKLFETGNWDESKKRVYWQFGDTSGVKVGGYPAFAQNDPRELTSIYDTLLFQWSSEIELDCGIINFFINNDKLALLDFNDVLYNWDCT